MMTLFDCTKGMKVKVLRINSDTLLKQRLISFGIMKEAHLEVLEYAPAKSTIEVKVAKTRVALRDQEAKLIEVEIV